MRNTYIGSTVSNPHTFPASVARPKKAPEPVRGLGDLVHAVLKALGIVWLVQRTERVTGKPCGCAARRAALNARFPSYPQSENANPSKVDEPSEPI